MFQWIVGVSISSCLCTVYLGPVMLVYLVKSWACAFCNFVPCSSLFSSDCVEALSSLLRVSFTHISHLTQINVVSLSACVVTPF